MIKLDLPDLDVFALDAMAAGYKVTVIAGLSKGVAPDTTAQALIEMESKGVTILKELE